MFEKEKVILKLLLETPKICKIDHPNWMPVSVFLVETNLPLETDYCTIGNATAPSSHLAINTGKERKMNNASIKTKYDPIIGW